MKIITLNSKDIFSSMRIDGSYHLSDAVLYEKAVEKNCTPLSVYCSSIFTAGRNKRMYTKKEYGYPYLSNSDVISQNPFQNCKYNSIKYGYDTDSFLTEGMVVTGRVGAIAQTAYVTKEFENKQAMGSDNIIRIITKNQKQSGFIYAFLSSKIGKAFLWKLATGGVQPYITENMVANIPIPIFSTDKQEEIHSLIVEAAKLRVDANRLLEEAHKRLSSELLLIKRNRINNSFSIKTINQSHTERFESSYYLSIGRDYIDQILSRNEYTYLKDVTSDIFRPGIFKRIYVNSNGITFLGGADIVKANPNSDKKISKKTKGIEKLKLKKDWILCTCGGTIGNVVYVDSEIAKCTASQHILRLIPNEKIQSGYLYALLSSEIGNEMIKSYTYGSVIPQIEPHHIELLPIPKINKETENEIHGMVMNYVHYLESAKQLESKAIQLVETEIDQWQQ